MQNALANSQAPRMNTLRSSAGASAIAATPLPPWIVSLLMLTFFASVTQAQSPSTAQAPEPAKALIKKAVKASESSGKSICVIFHASWCGWCKRLESALDAPEVKPLMEKHFITVRLDVLEQPAKKSALENAGAEPLLKDLGGEKSGLPFYAFLDAKEKKLADSNVMQGNSNIGYPGTAEEIAAFVKVLRTAAPKMTDAEADTISSYFKANAPKPSH